MAVGLDSISTVVFLFVRDEPVIVVAALLMFTVLLFAVA